MKKRRIVVVALMLVAVICVGVGYALTSAPITFNGTITYTPTFALVWNSVDNTGDITASVDGNDTTQINATINASNWVVNDAHTFEAVVSNPSKYDGNNFQFAYENPDPTCYDVSAAIKDNATTIAANGGEVTVVITITLKNYPTTENVYTENFKVTVTADQVTGA